MTITQFDPERHLTSTIRALVDYTVAAFDPDIVDVRSEFPQPDLWKVPVSQVVIHFALDDPDPRPVGFANGTLTREIYDEATQTTSWQEATAFYRMNFDVGVWAFEEAGGSTARMETHEALHRLFTGPGADNDLNDATGGISIISFTGGRHVPDTIDGLPVWRVTNMTLVVEVCGRRSYSATDAVGGYDQDPEIVIDSNQPVITP